MQAFRLIGGQEEGCLLLCNDMQHLLFSRKDIKFDEKGKAAEVMPRAVARLNCGCDCKEKAGLVQVPNSCTL